MFRFGLLSALGLTFAVFLPLSVCPRWLSSGFSAVSSGVGGFSRFRRSADRLRLSDVAPCAFGRSVCPRLLFIPFCPVSVAVGAWVCWSVAVRLSVGVCSVRLFPLHSFRRSDLLRLGAFVRLPLGFGGLLLAVPRSPFSTVLRLFVPFVRSRFNLPFTLAVGIGSTLYCGSCPQCWRFMLCRSDGSPTFAAVGRLSSNYSFSLPI